jgi:hypothetical protein
MLWPIILLTLLATLFVFLFWQIFVISKEHNFDKVLYTFRELEDRALLKLADNIIEERGAPLENIEFRNFIETTSNTIRNFDLLKKDFVNMSSFKRLFINIDKSYKKIEHTELEFNKETHMLKAEFVANLKRAFRSIPLFRFRLIVILFFMILRLTAKILQLLSLIGLHVMSSKIDKLLHIEQTYNSIEKSNENGLCL